MKKSFVALLASLTIVLAACSNDGEVAVAENENEKLPEENNTESNVEQNETVNTEKVVDKTESKEEKSTNTQEPGENLLKEDIVLEYENGDVVITLNHAEFTKEFTTSTGADPRSIIADSEIYLHLTGKISNDTLNLFHYGHKLAPVRFKAIYDNKHEFDFLATTESLDGTKFDGASIDSLQEQTIHLYAQVPMPVSERDNSLVFVIVDSEGEHEVVLR
ncbi:hypothetical protein ACIQYS_17040 [Psychrobacillus sp. NPDC096426]|uniref:hypothetical protein n=1 Tax=Psychrobacillus sp. NPDC096426 TaxID=3364491 RepID=UPI0037FFFC7A